MRQTKLTNSLKGWRAGLDGVEVVLTPDDILELKLLRDEYKQWIFERHRSRCASSEKTLETLERILKQVQ